MHNSTDPYTSIPTALRGIAGYLIRSGHTIDPSVFEVLTHCANGVGALGEQAARIAELESQLEAIGAGGVEPLRSRCLHQIAEPTAATHHGIAAWMTPEGDRIVTEATMAGARKDGGAILSSLRNYSVALVRAAAPKAEPADQLQQLTELSERAGLYDADFKKPSVAPSVTRFNPADGSPETALQIAAVIALHDADKPAGKYPALPEPAFRLFWDGDKGCYRVTEPGIEDVQVYTDADMRAYADATCAKRAAQFATADNRAAFKAYLEDCDECAIVPDIAGAFNAGWTSCVSAEQPAGAQAAPAAVAGPSDDEILALNAGEIHFSESPSKYPWAGHGTQYHAGAPGVLNFARAVLARWGAAPTTQAAPQPAAQQGGYQAALNIRTAQGWKLTRKAIPVLYTDTINGQQVMRDDVWLCTSAALAQPHEAAPVAQGDAEDAARYRWLVAHCRSTAEHWRGRWAIVVEGPAPELENGEYLIDEAIDAARAKAKEGVSHG